MDIHLYQLIVTFVVIIFSIVLHEVAHGYVAYLYNDPTAKHAGRLTLNPIPHIDPLGSIIVPLGAMFMMGSWFGWAKPVPVDERYLHTKISRFFVAAAGVLVNLSIAVVAFSAAKILFMQGMINQSVVSVLFTVIIVNLSLFFFNLIPIPPFDGMAILESLFPRLRINHAFVYNPLYMIMAIIVASFIFSLFAPSLFGAIYAVIL